MQSTKPASVQVSGKDSLVQNCLLIGAGASADGAGVFARLGPGREWNCIRLLSSDRLTGYHAQAIKLFFMSGLLAASHTGYAQTVIDEAGYRITVPDNYVLGKDLTALARYGIEVHASNVNVDFAGHVIDNGSAQGLDGVIVGRAERVTIQNGTVSNFLVGFVLLQSSQIIVQNMRVVGSRFKFDGIHVVSTTYSLIQNNYIVGEGNGGRRRGN